MDKKLEGYMVGEQSFQEWLDDLDREVLELGIKPNEILWAAYQYFDSSPAKPLNPREFLQFWHCLDLSERLLLLLELDE